MTHTLRAGGVDLRRFLYVAAPATLACLLLVPALVLGWVSIAIASAHPIDIGTTHGSAGSLYLAPSTDRAVTAIAAGQPGERSVALVNVSDGRLDDLCLLPRVDLPLLHRTVAVRISTSGDVHLGEITLAASEGSIAGLALPGAELGMLDGDPVPGKRAAGGFNVRTTDRGGRVDFTGMDLAAFGLVLDDGLQLRTLTLRAAVGEQSCTSG